VLIVILKQATPIYKKGRKEDPRNYRPVSLTSVPGKVMELFIPSALTGHAKDNQGIRPSQNGFMKGMSCLANPISFYDKVSCLVDEGKDVEVISLDFSKDFDTVPNSILLEKLAAHGLDGCPLCWIKNWIEWPSTESGGKWSQIQLAASHEWCPPELSFGSDLVEHLHQ